MLKVPILNSVLKKLAVARITGGMGILINNGVPLLKSLKIIKEITGNKIYKKEIETIALKVERGIPLSQAFFSVFSVQLHLSLHLQLL